jgi:hypothetical protein
VINSNFHAHKIKRRAEELAQAMNEAAADGNRVTVEFDWDPGIDAMFRVTRVHTTRVVVNGVEVEK